MLSVVWKITPLFADWMTSSANPLFGCGILHRGSNLLELGCGCSGILAMTLAPRVDRYIASDQNYVMKLLKENLDQNSNAREEKGPSSGSRSRRHDEGRKTSRLSSSKPLISTLTLDWEHDRIVHGTLFCEESAVGRRGLDAVIACDCIYNQALIDPLVQTCVDACNLRTCTSTPDETRPPTICIIAQQLRSPDVFQAWLTVFHASFRTWSIPNELLTDQIKSGSGFVVHVGILRDRSRSTSQH